MLSGDRPIVEAHRLTSNEAALTGESVPVDKDPGLVDPAAPMAERRDHVFTGTAISTGTGGGASVSSTGSP